MKPKPDMNIKKALSERIRQIRFDSGLNQENFAKSIGISRVHLSRMENPSYAVMPGKIILNRICSEYAVNFNWLEKGVEPRYHTADAHMSGSYMGSDLNTQPDNVGDVVVINTKSRIYTKTQDLLEQGELPLKRFLSFCADCNNAYEILFNLLEDIKEAYTDVDGTNENSIPNSSLLTETQKERYLERFKNLLDEI